MRTLAVLLALSSLACAQMQRDPDHIPLENISFNDSGTYTKTLGSGVTLDFSTGAGFTVGPLTLKPSATVTIASNPALVAHGAIYGTTGWIFEGLTADAYETLLLPADVGADATITMPNSTSALIGSTLTTNNFDVLNSIWGASNALVFEGATADGFEMTVSPADPGADVTVTIPATTTTLAGLAVAQTFSVAQSFTAGIAPATDKPLLIRRAVAGTGTDTETLSIAELFNGIFVQTPTGATTCTTPTGTEISAGLTTVAVGDSFEFTLINLGTTGRAVTFTAGASGVTLVGRVLVDSPADVATDGASEATWVFVNTASNTWIAYRR